MKRCNKFMAVVAVILAFALTFMSVSMPAEAATTSVKSIIGEGCDHSNGRTAGDRREAEQDISDG